MRRECSYLAVLALCGGTTFAAKAEQATPLSALAKMPVREITVFKDGHAFVLHSGKMPTDSGGNVQLDYLPTPVIGTFWPYSADKNVKLAAVTASQRRVLVERTALSVREMLEANPGADIGYTEVGGTAVTSAKIVGVPQRSGDELEATGPTNAEPKLPEKGGIILLKTEGGVSVMGVDRIQNVTFKSGYTPKVTNEEFRSLLTLKLEWPGAPAKMADVGMVYLQKGVRWIPGYKITIDGKGDAVVRLQATLINELTDLSDVTTNLVIGVPSFFFKDTPDPISLQQSFGQLSTYFQNGSQTGFAFSNSIATQVGGRMSERMGGGQGLNAAGQAPDLGPEVAGSDRSEDLFVFTVKHITLKKGQRMVVPVAEYPLKYRDVYTLDVPFAPPLEVRGNFNSEQQAELARLMNAPKALHKIRFVNKSTQPLTTAPALIVRDDRVLAQGMMTYTAPGAETDLTLTTAVDIKVKKTDKETSRTPNAAVWQDHKFGRVDLNGTITLTNFRDQPVEIEVTRYVLGNVGKADHDGTATMVNVFEDETYAPVNEQPYWWNWYNWPTWWRHFNSIGRLSWKIKLEGGKSADLGYTWHYFWE